MIAYNNYKFKINKIIMDYPSTPISPQRPIGNSKDMSVWRKRSR